MQTVNSLVKKIRMYQATFNIVDSRDFKFNLFSFVIFFFAILICIVSIYTSLINHFPKLIFFILAETILLQTTIRFFFFGKYKKTGDLIISDNEITIKEEAILLNIKAKKFNFYFNGCYADNLTGRVLFPANSGTKNVLTITSTDNKSYALNIYLKDEFEKNKLYKILERYSEIVGIPVEYS